jgi:hypothetical protein
MARPPAGDFALSLIKNMSRYLIGGLMMIFE